MQEKGIDDEYRNFISVTTSTNNALKSVPKAGDRIETRSGYRMFFFVRIALRESVSGWIECDKYILSSI
jgi:hypothetical protein